MTYINSITDFENAAIQELTREEIGHVDGGARVQAAIKFLDWVGRAMTAHAVVSAVSKAAKGIDVGKVGDPMDTKLGINTGK
ncbi:MAG: hypothetical protein ACJLS3_14310 [Erythrobacter sp.]